ncbi:MAG: shikimate dehydrogenase [Betaproteobacteria bacterium]|nr:shikimate dehydrogenase [Betaproteobacteria bacterium]
MRIDGHTRLIPHIGYPTHSFKAPLIYNPFFESKGLNAMVIPMSCQADNFETLLRSLFRLGNVVGALITMPHKVSAAELVDELSPAARIAGACNAVRLGSSGRLQGDLFDGEGFVRGLLRKGVTLRGCRALVVGAGGVGSAIAASLAAAGVAGLGLFDVRTAAAESLGDRLRQHYPGLKLTLGQRDPTGYEVVVNATPLGMNEGDPLPIDVDRLHPSTLVGEVVMRTEITAFLAAARQRGCAVQVGSDMLFEQIPAYLEYFDLPSTTPEVLRSLARA